jgi:polyisoprenoid-binding protein YceI
MRGRNYLVAVPLAVVALAAAAAPLGPGLSLQSGSKVWVEGTSTTRSYRCESTRVAGTAATTAQAPTIQALASAVRTADISVPVASLDCRNGTMNGHMRRALKADQAPTIRFRATSIQLVPTGAAAGTVRMTGPLTIAGRDQTVTLEGTVAAEGNGVRVRGSERFNMTSYGVEPPRLMLGALKVHDPVTVHFDVLLRP